MSSEEKNLFLPIYMYPNHFIIRIDTLNKFYPIDVTVLKIYNKTGVKFSKYKSLNVQIKIWKQPDFIRTGIADGITEHCPRCIFLQEIMRIMY